MNIAVPWNLSHYIPFNGFRPLYRALFDHAPSDIGLVAWDNVKLHRHFASSAADRKRVLCLANSYRSNTGFAESGTLIQPYAGQFYPPDRVLTEALNGEIEFHHTAPFPSLTRPFVLHCESLEGMFCPNQHWGQARSDTPDELRLHYGRLFKSPLCQGIYSHIPETLHDFSRCFSDTAIDDKLFNSKIGLSRLNVSPGLLRPRRPVDRPRFLFVDSTHQKPTDFFNRGGHIVLRFWKEFRTAGQEGTLVLRCQRPANNALARYGVDTAFIQGEIGRSIIWTEVHLSHHEINALMADAHFFLLPSETLDSDAILLAMTLGTVPVVTDTVGTSVYVTDQETAIVLKDVRNETWHCSPERMRSVAASLVAQLVERVSALRESTEAYDAMSRRISERARVRFSGETFASEFWEAVMERAQRAGNPARHPSAIAGLKRLLRNCKLDPNAWSKVFESSAQPKPLLDTGTSKIFELGGAVIQVPGNETMRLTDWSVFAQYFNTNAPQTSFVDSLVELDPYLSGPNNSASMLKRNLRNWASTALIPFPKIHSFASQSYHWIRRARTITNRWVR